MSTTKTRTCECGTATGQHCPWTGPAADTVTLEWMPLHLRASHEAAGNSGRYPDNGALRLRVAAECAEALLEADGEWTEEV